jgi:hypothetical protein
MSGSKFRRHNASGSQPVAGDNRFFDCTRPDVCAVSRQSKKMAAIAVGCHQHSIYSFRLSFIGDLQNAQIL